MSGAGRVLCLTLCAVVVGTAAADESAPGVSELNEQTSPAVEIDASPEVFRRQLVEFLHDLETTLGQALDNPLIAEQIRSRVGAHPLQLPLPPEVYAAIEAADPEELELLQTTFASAPFILEVPATLAIGLAEIPEISLDQREARGSCGTNYQEFANIGSKKPIFRNLTRASTAITLARTAIEMIADAINASFEDVPIIGSKVAIALYVPGGILHIAESALAIAANEFKISMSESQLCLDSCLSDSGDVHAEDSGLWRGKGCDNRDNNCDSQGDIDEAAEDRFGPEVAVDASIMLECYPDQSSANGAAQRAVTMTDDCKLAGSSVNVSPVVCGADVTATATDTNNNQVMRSFRLKVDGDSPVISPPALAACYPTVAAANGALAMTSVVDPNGCSAVQTSIDVVEKECVADFELEAVDECGNRSSVRETVRVDDSPPDVNIETLNIPSIDGLSCFASEDEAIDTVVEATQFSDTCTAQEDLTFTTTTSGKACNLTITNTVQDECAGITTSPSADSLLVRVDTEPPTMSCSVAEPILSRPDDKMVDVGFNLVLSDNCDPAPTFDVLVTSDEPTRFSYAAEKGTDPFPDAEVQRGADGSIERILLRAQRRKTGGYDGRVYRIRVVATDACGLSSKTECWVTVPPTPGQGTAVNSGQTHDATQKN